MPDTLRSKSPLELTATERSAWAAIQLADRTFESPYFHPGWTEAVASVRDGVHVLVIDDAEGQPVGFWPYERREGTAVAVGAPLNDYQGAIVRPGVSLDVAAVLDAAGVGRWHFDHLLASQSGLDDFEEQSDSSPYLDLSGGVDGYLQSCGKNGRRQYKSIQKKGQKAVAELGPARFESDCRDPAVLEQVIEWKSAQYRATNLPDVFAVDWTRDLLARLHGDRSEGDAFGGRLAALWLGDRLAAAHFGMRSGPVVHWWFPTYDEELAEHSPGWQLLVAMVEAAEADGIDRIDLGKGMSQFKRKAMSGEIALREGLIEPSPIRRAIRRTGLTVKQRLKQSGLRTALRGPASWLFHRSVNRTLES